MPREPRRVGDRTAGPAAPDLTTRAPDAVARVGQLVAGTTGPKEAAAIFWT